MKFIIELLVQVVMSCRGFGFGGKLETNCWFPIAVISCHYESTKRKSFAMKVVVIFKTLHTIK